MLKSKTKNLFLQGFSESWNHWTAFKVDKYASGNTSLGVSEELVRECPV